MKMRLVICLICQLVIANVCYGYLVGTHEELAAKAAEASVLAAGIEEIGIGSLDDEITRSSVFSSETKTVRDWIRTGAAYEDNTLLATREFARYRHHFYNPLTGEGLTGHFSGLPSPSWGLEDQGEIPDQDFSLRDAREYFYRSLTTPMEHHREGMTALTLRTIGQIIHLIQDAAQPEHTRNDSHASGSLYEKLTDGKINDLVYGGYPVVVFNNARKYFHTLPPEGEIRSGDGIAEYSNRGFVSAGTNFVFDGSSVISDPRFPFPEFDPTTELTIDITQLIPGTHLRGELNFFGNLVSDTKTGRTAFNPFMTTLSIFDADLRNYKITPGRLFTLNRFNFDVAHGLLIPRAVGYSAGFIDYFFRGRLEVVDPKFTDEGVSLKVKNAIDRNKIPEWASEHLYREDSQGNLGQFVLTLKYKQNDVEQLVTSEPVTLKTQSEIPPGVTSSETLTFELPALPDGATAVEYRLVFRGRLGEEDDAVAVGRIIPTGNFVVLPSYLAADGISGTRLIVKSAGKWRLTEHTNLRGGNIDWKGAYVNGKPTKVLSWWGPRARHFPNLVGEDPFRNQIFQNGEIFAFAPCRVLGAAITKDLQGQEWLIAVCGAFGVEHVFRRPNKKSTSSAGWEEIAASPWGPEFKAPNRPWFFNGDGTEAQTLRELQIPTGEGGGIKTARLKITIVNGESASIQNLGNLDGWKVVNTLHRLRTGELGTFDASREQSTETIGRYLAAVDYDDSREILCGAIADFKGSVLATATRVHVPNAKLPSRTYTKTENQTSTIVLSCGSFRFELLQLVMSESIDFSSSETTGEAGSKERSWEEQRHQIEYFDPRHDLIVTESVGRSQRETLSLGSLIGFSGCRGVYSGTGDVSSTTVENDAIRYGQQSLRPFNFSTTSTGSEGRILVEFVESSGGCFGPGEISSTFTSTNYGSIGGDPLTEGSWVVDTDANLAVSQTKGASHLQPDFTFGTGEYFNFLTGDDLEQLIPTAPDDARYFPIFVVR